MHKQYESGQVTVNWYNTDLSTGWAEDTFLTIEPLAAQIDAKFGSDGAMGVSKMANKGATITMTFMQTAKSNKDIGKVAFGQDQLGEALPVAPFSVIDKTGESCNFLALNAVLTEKSGHSFGNTMGEKTWTWVCESYLEADDPSTITAALESLVPVAQEGVASVTV